MANDDNKNDDKPEAETDEVHVAKPGHKDKGTIVTGALGEKLPGYIADIADGDT